MAWSRSYRATAGVSRKSWTCCGARGRYQERVNYQFGRIDRTAREFISRLGEDYKIESFKPEGALRT
jgi:hypothetical protein